MTLETMKGADIGHTEDPQGRRILKTAIEELQGLTKELVAGNSATTNIAIAGIKTTDTILSVLHLTAGAASADLTSEASITSDGNIQLSSTDTTGDQLWVEFYSKP